MAKSWEEKHIGDRASGQNRGLLNAVLQDSPENFHLRLFAGQSELNEGYLKSLIELLPPHDQAKGLFFDMMQCANDILQAGGTTLNASDSIKHMLEEAAKEIDRDGRGF